ncbi:MAG: hypothetical protein JWO32_622 [Bacteroidetes bacterium]|nr:hypothetical protein [Bacteroidota bacterium]
MLFFTWFYSFSQTKDSIVSNYIRELSSIWTKNAHITFNEYLNYPEQNVLSVPPLYTIGSNVSNNQSPKNSLQIQINQLEQKIYKKDPGLSFIAAYQKNFKSPIADPEDIVIFKQKFQTGVQWDFFRSGLYDSRSRLKELQYKEKALIYQSLNAVSGPALKTNLNKIIYLLNEEKIIILQHRKTFVESFANLTGQLLSLNQISKENYIKVQQHLNDIAYQLNVYQGYNDLHANLKLSAPEKIILPVFDIDYNKIAEQFINASLVDSSAYYNMLAAGTGNYFLKDLSLNANAKYNFYDVYNSNVPNRSYMSVGVNLSVPLAFNQKDKKERDLLTAQLLAQNSKPKSSLDTQNVILNSLYEFKYKQKQYGNLLQKRELFEELIRNEKVKYHYGSVEFNPLTANIILDDLWSTIIELLDLKQDMYRILNELKINLPSLNVSQIIKPYTFEPVTMSIVEDQSLKDFKTIKAVYVWSDVFKTNSPASVINYCKLNNFNTLVVSVNKTDVSQVNEMMALSRDFNFELLIGSNKLLLNDHIQIYLDSLTALVKLNKVSAIHLDVEPHTFEDFKANKEVYFAKYLDLLAKAHSFTQKHKLKLSVSIPLNYPENVLTSIFEKCDHVYLMAYENVKPSFINEKIKEELSQGKEKVVLAFRTNDFSNKAQMDELFSSLKIKHVAYHDLDELIKMSKKNLNKGAGR